MNKLNLNNVTLVCLDDYETDLALQVVRGVCKFIDFGDTKVLASKKQEGVTQINPINTLGQYNRFVIKELYKYIDTEFLMFVQTDGYPLNLQAWTDEFLNYDYIGAPWIWASPQDRPKICPAGACVGNGGFSIRSKKIMEEVSKYDYDLHNNAYIKRQSSESRKSTGLQEDAFICRVVDKELKSKGMKFAPCELAKYFSVENMVYTGQFGFHGKSTININKKAGIFSFKDHAYEGIH